MRGSRWRSLLVVPFVLLAGGGVTLASTQTFTPAKDTFVRSDLPNNNFGSQGGFEVGRTPAKLGGAAVKRGLLHFDISALPPGVVITDATLRMLIWATGQLSDLPIAVSRLTADFVEGDGMSGVTWSTQPGIESSPIHTATMSTLVGDWFEMDVTAVVAAEHGSADPGNVLVRIAPTNETTVEDRWFRTYSKEYPDDPQPAELVVEYAIPTPTPTSTPTATPTATPTNTPVPTPTPEEVGPPPDLNPPPLDRTIATTIDVAAEFLYSGPTPVQTGVAVGAIDLERAAVIRGLVFDSSGEPLEGVEIGILGTPEYGSTLTRASGIFDMAVNGGGLLTVTYSKPGFIPAQRQIDVPWQDFAWASDVVLLAYDASVTTLDLSAPGDFQVADGSVVTDSDGTRQVRLLFAEGTQATLVLADGSTQPASMPIAVRVTEFTVGESGPDRMPAELPPTSGYTYAAELSIDEAVSTGASEVVFSQPVIFYLENFIDLPVGLPVPTGYYDRLLGQWVPSSDGRIVKIVGFDAFGRAELDTDGNDVADNDPALGITDAERAELATPRYSTGQSLWRVPITHFTPWDCNYPYVPPEDAEAPSEEPQEEHPEDEFDCQKGSTIECQNQVLGEALPITGTPFQLHYRSDRAPGYRPPYTLEIPLSGESVPASLKRIELTVSVAGRLYRSTAGPEANQRMTFTWDGRDGYGRIMQGSQRATIAVGYVYDAVYAEPNVVASSFARFSGVPINSSPTRQEVTISRAWQRTVGTWDAGAQGLGGWTLDVHHVLSLPSAVYFGDGRHERAQPRDRIIDTVAGNGTPGSAGDGGSATAAELDYPYDIDVAPDGSLYIADNLARRVRRVDPEGIITTVAGNGSSGVSTPGVPATASPLTPFGIAAAADGSFYVSNSTRVFHVDRNGILQLFAGTSISGYNGDDIPATGAQLRGPRDMELGPDGSVYIADRLNHRIRRVGTDGIISTVAGTGGSGADGDGGPATSAQIGEPWGVAVGGDGSVYIADFANEVIRRVGPDGIISTVAGVAGEIGYDGDGGPATAAHLSGALGVKVDRDGTVYIPDTFNFAVRRVGVNGIITTLAGTGVGGFTGEGGPAAAARIGHVQRVALGGDGSLLLGDTSSSRIRRIRSPLTDTTLIPSADGRVAHQFDGQGRHLHTRHAMTGSTPLDFGYDDGLLVAVTDGDGKETTIERDGSGNPTAIVGPFGQRTTLGLDPNGYLSSMTNPAGETTRFTYTADGLMTGMTDRRDHPYSFQYDSEGRLERDDDLAGGFKLLSRNEDDDGFSVALETALGRETTYVVQNLPTGDQQRINTDAAGLATTTLIKADGTREQSTPDGTTITSISVGDPRFSMLAPVTKTRTLSTPGGLLSTTTTQRTASLSDPDDPLTLTDQTDTVTINGRPFTTSFSAGPPATNTSTSAEERQTISTLDSQGRVTKTELLGTNPVLHPSRRQYDGQGRLSAIKHGPDPDTAQTRITTFTYKSTADDQNGLLDTITDPIGRETQFEYDEVGRLITQTFLPGTAEERQITYAYDPNDNLTSITPPGQPAHTFDYTEVDLEKEYLPPPVSPADPKTTYSYNEDRQLTEILRPGGETVGLDYDPDNGRLESLTLPAVPQPGTEVRDYTYHSTTGNLATLTGPNATLSFGYDGSLLTSEQWSAGAVTTTVTHGYDDDFRLDSLQVNAEAAILFAYDGDGLLTSAGALTPIMRHEDYGFVTATTLGAVTDAWTYSPFGELESYEADVGGDSEYAVQYTRDKLGRIVTKTETIGGVTTLYEYDYDLAGRLYRVEENGNLVSEYTYDENGNRTGGFTEPTGTILSTTYDDQDRLIEYVTTLGGTRTYAYTENGELETKTDATGTTTYAYDALGNLRTVVLPGAPPTTIEYLIDGRNRRIGKKVNGSVVKRWVYKDQLNPVAELDGAGNLVAQFVYGTKSNVPDYMIKYGADAGTYRIVSDHLGSPRLVVDVAGGNVAQQLHYDEFGMVLQETNPGFQPFGFAGGIYDPNTGLVRFGARDYDATVERWTLKDLIGFSGGDTNLYGYVLSDPINFLDPWGMAIGDFPPAPPGYNPHTWALTQYDNGPWVLKEPGGRRWLLHPEDRGHWRHWDKQGPGGEDEGRWPPNSTKPWPNQKRAPYGDQCGTDPSGDTPGFDPTNPQLPMIMIPPLHFPLPGLSPIQIPVPILAW